MTPAEVKEIYRQVIGEFGEAVSLRRYSGTGNNRTATDYPVGARVTEYRPDELIGGIVQGDRLVIVLAADVASTGFQLPFVATADKLVVRGRELAIKAIDDNTRRIAGEIVAYEIRAGG